MTNIEQKTKKSKDTWDNLRDGAKDDPKMRPGPVLTCLADVEPREINWLWPHRIPLGRITLLVGRPGEGKSFLTTDMAARISTGTPWPDGSECPAGSVIIVSAEDDPNDTIRPRLDAHHADCAKIHLLSAVRRLDDKGKTREVMFGLGDVAALEDAMKAIPDCKLIVIDPVGSFLGGDTDSHRDNEVRSVLAPVAQLAEKYGAAVLIVAHRRKSAGSNADEMALGSRAFTGIARAVWHLCRQSDVDPGTRDAEQITGKKSPVRLLLPGKMNLCEQPDGLSFAITGDPARLVWSKEPVMMSADDGLAAENAASENEKPGPEPETRNMAEDWLRDELADLAGHPVAAIKESASSAGVGSWKTIQRAAQAIGVVSERATFGGGYVWRISNPSTLRDSLQDSPTKKETTCPPVPQGAALSKTANSAGQVPLQDKLFSLVPQGESGSRIGLLDARIEGHIPSYPAIPPATPNPTKVVAQEVKP